MQTHESLRKLAAAEFLLLFALACSISFNSGESEAEQTLQAIYQEYTQTAMAAGPADDGAGEDAPEIVIEHETIPGNPGKADVEKDEIDTENTADTKTALGDSFRLGNFERPFTEDDMVYHPDTDMVRLLLSRGDEFYYFTLELSGTDKDENYPTAGYGIEFDTDYDGRGDYLLWATGNGSTDWTITDVMLLEDSDNDVGGASPVVPDNNEGDGYDRVLFSKDVLDDPDVAWQRVDPGDGNNVQLAVKTSYIDNTRFYWRGWADKGVADPALFDYNDSFSESQAGSPNKNSNYYPVGQLNLMDSTCWIAYNLEPTGTELGGCVQIQPTQPPPPPKEDPCVCVPGCFGTDPKCCNQCPGCIIWDNGACGPELY